MKLKYYMRGLGIGIILTTLILSLSGMNKKMTNEEIKRAAYKLGMVDKEDLEKEKQEENLEKVLESDSTEGDNTEAEVTPEPTVTEVPGPTAVPDTKPTVTPSPSPTPTPRPTPIPTPEPIVKVEEEVEGEVTFTIEKGMSSRMVSALLESKGIVDSAEEFNNYIREAGKAGVIRIGSYTVPKGASYDVILDKITSK